MSSRNSFGAYSVWNSISKGLLVTRVRRRVLHAERSAALGGWILASNHISHFDPPILSSVVRRPVDWMAMEELFRNPVSDYFYRSVGAFPIRRSRADRSALKTAGDRLAAGRVVGIFPEGGLRTGANSVLEGAALKPGIALVSARAQTPILPCVVLGSDRLYRTANWLPGPRIPLWIAFGEQIVPDPQLEMREAIARIESELAMAFLELKAALVREFALGPADFPQTPQFRKEEK